MHSAVTAEAELRWVDGEIAALLQARPAE